MRMRCDTEWCPIKGEYHTEHVLTRDLGTGRKYWICSACMMTEQSAIPITVTPPTHLPDLHPDAVGAEINGRFFPRQEYEEIRREARSAEWSQDWPTEPGWYWFWGVCYRQYGDVRPITDVDRHLIMVQVTVHPGDVVYWGNGQPLHKMIAKPANGGAVGVWQRAVVPNLPVTDDKQTP